MALSSISWEKITHSIKINNCNDEIMVGFNNYINDSVSICKLTHVTYSYNEIETLKSDALFLYLSLIFTDIQYIL